MLETTAAIILKDNFVFIAQKGPEVRFAHLWEFPGGKIDPGETPEECVKRELFEEFTMEIEVFQPFAETVHIFPEGQLRVFAFFCRWTGGNICLTEHEDYAWVPIQQLGEYQFVPADIPLANKLMSEKPLMRPYGKNIYV